MRIPSLLPLLSALSPAAHAATNHLINKCAWDVYYTQVGGAGPIESPRPLPAGSNTSVAQFFHDSGTSIKITKTGNGIWTAAPVLQFAYSYQAGKDIYYGIAKSNGYEYYGEVVRLGGEYGSDVEEIVWRGGPGREYTAHHGGETDLTFTICDD